MKALILYEEYISKFGGNTEKCFLLRDIVFFFRVYRNKNKIQFVFGRFISIKKPPLNEQYCKVLD